MYDVRGAGLAKRTSITSDCIAALTNWVPSLPGTSSVGTFLPGPLLLNDLLAVSSLLSDLRRKRRLHLSTAGRIVSILPLYVVVFPAIRRRSMISQSRSVPSRFRRAGTLLAWSASLAALSLSPAVASAQSWYGALMGTNEVPSNASTATGFVSMSLNGNFLSVSLSWNGLIAPPVAAHIHCCTAPGSNIGVAVGFIGLPASTSGTYTNMFDLSDAATYTSSYLTGFGGGTAGGGKAALVDGLNSGRVYVNIHNAPYPAGEIRANVVVTPEPASIAMLTFGLCAVGVVVRRRRHTV